MATLMLSTLLKQMRSSSLVSVQGKEKGEMGIVKKKKKRLTGGSLMWTEWFRVWGANGSLLVAQ